MLVPKKAECFIVLQCVHRQDLNGYSCTVVLAADRRCQQSEPSAGFFVRQFGAKTGTRNGDSYFMERTIFRVPIALADFLTEITAGSDSGSSSRFSRLRDDQLRSLPPRLAIRGDRQRVLQRRQPPLL
jgi:hypothetical protein